MTTVRDLSGNAPFAVDDPVDAGIKLLDQVDEDSASKAVRISGLRTVSVEAAAFGGGTVAFQMQGPDGTWMDITDGTFTANGSTNLLFSGEVDVRANFSGSTGASNVSAEIGAKRQ